MSQIMDYHPKEVVLTAMWLACKVEHFPHRYVLHYSSSCSGSSRVSIGPRYLNQEKVIIEPNKREFKYDSRAFADFGKVQTIHTIPFPEFHRRVASSPVVLLPTLPLCDGGGGGGGGENLSWLLISLTVVLDTVHGHGGCGGVNGWMDGD